MNPIFQTYRPKGFSTVNSYLFSSAPSKLIEFITKAFHGEVIQTSYTPEGDIGNCIIQIGDTNIMISQARGDFNNMRTALYLYVNDVDLMHQSALKNGATELFPPADMDYQDRQSGVIDCDGNYWWISMRLVEKGYEE